METKPAAMAWVFVIIMRSPDGAEECREFMVYDERLATIIRRTIFDKTATTEEFEEFARQVDADPELAREWASVRQQLETVKIH